jgi:hypothetical protein
LPDGVLRFDQRDAVGVVEDHDARQRRVSDPKGMSRNISKLGRWGNGDVEVPIKALEEMPYVMGLVRQSYGRQMGDAGTP